MSKRLSKLVTAAVLLGAIAVGHSNGTASAAAAPLAPRPAGAVTADALPTVQVDGVVWSQAIVGNAVYAGGNFQNARPAGAAPGTNLVPRSNLLAFDITTGALITSFAPQLNGQVLAVAASPDGSRVYVAGDFTTADGQPRKRLAAYDTATGQLIASFDPKGPSSQARALAVTNDTVYVGGGFGGTGATVRNNLLALRASDGALLAWDPNADYTVSALALSDDGASVFAGGSFQNVGGQPAYGLAKIGATTGALLPWSATAEVRNAGQDAGVTSLRTAHGMVYGTAYHFGTGGNLEGPFSVSQDSGALTWAADCHGDTYSSAESNGVVYVVGHSHYCGNVGGGFPQPSGWDYQRGIAFTVDAAGTNLHETKGYPKDWFGRPSPSIVHWLPLIAQGSFTGQSQGAWSVAATDNYVVLGGEFPRVNSTNQQGLVRFGRPSVAPNAQGPQLDSGSWVPTLAPTSTTSLRVSWKAAADRDDRTLTYKVIRDNAWGSPRYLGTIDSNWWNIPVGGFIDTGLTPGTTYRYQIVVSDPAGRTVFSSSATATTPTTWSQTPHATAVMGAAPSMYWPLDQAASPLLAASGMNDGAAGTSVAFAQAGIDTGKSIRLDGTSSSRVSAIGNELAPQVFSAQAWIKTTTTSGGRILGFGDLRTGSSGHRDRHLYMQNDGRLAFGIWAAGGMVTVVSSKSYNDNQWHQVTGTFGLNGMQLYVDGVRVAIRGEITEGQQYVGAWRVGGDDLTAWPSKPSKNDFTGNVDEVAIYPTVLSQQQIDDEWRASGRTSLLPTAPADAYGAAVFADEPLLYYRLGESSGTAAADSSAALSPGTYRGSGFTFGQTGAVVGIANTAVRSSGTSGYIASNTSYPAPQIYSIETWFKSTSTQGGKLIGFGNSGTANSSTTDRHIYMQNDGKVVFGILNGSTQVKVTTAKSLNNGQWHHVVGTQSGAGIVLYVDGQPVGVNPQATAQSYTGFWRVGGDTTWGSTSRFLSGTLDEAAVYPTALSAARVAEHFARGGGVVGNQPPTASFTSSSTFLAASFDGSGSTDTEGPIASYAWNFGDGSTGSGATPTHTYAAAGTYPVTLTVTDGAGVIASTANNVTVVANRAPTAAFTSSTAFLAATFDASGSSDIDGPIATYAWNFGDGSNGTGMNPSHTYAAAGTYHVTLTVTDSTGATGVVTNDVTLVANQAPTAAFTSSSAFLDASFDGSTSSDPEGPIAGLAWDFGDGSTSTGVNPSHTYAAAGTYHVTLTVTDSTGATGAVTNDVTVVANQAPTAAFTSSNVFLAASFDGSGSSDTDGSLTSYAWDFGDGTTGSGAKPTHPYAAAGTYRVTLTVTDNVGVTAAVSQDVTVAAEPPNQAPTAAFTSSSVFLGASFDGSSSADPDGRIAGLAWDFGDGTTGSGPTASHTYAAAGPYTVTLTVTDDDGVTATTSQVVTVQVQPILAADTFGRTVTNGLGAAEVGGNWTSSAPATNFAVANGSASLLVANLGGSASAYLNTVSALNVDATVDVGYDKAATGGGFYTSLVARRIGTSDYRVKVRVMPTGTQVYLARTVGGVETVLSSGVVPGTYTPGSVLRVRLQATGTGTTTLKAKAWYTTSAEPATWNLTSTDGTASLQNPGAVGIYTYISGSATNAPMKTYIDNLWVGAL